MMFSGVTILIVLAIAALVTVGMPPARPGISIAFAGLTVAVGAALTFSVGLFAGLPMMVAGLIIGAIAVRRDAAHRRAKGPAP